jgi:acetolactate synthase-1/2/3 large subunit
MWSDGGQLAEIPAPPRPERVDPQRVAAVAKTLSGAGRAALLLGGDALSAEGQRAAARIAHTTGASLLAERSPAKIERGPDLPVVPCLPYFPEDVLRVLAPFTDLILIGTRTPVSFFGYPDLPSVPVPSHTRVTSLADSDADLPRVLDALEELTGSATATVPVTSREPVRAPEGALTTANLAAGIVLTQPEHVIIVNEALSSSAGFAALAASAPAHTELTQTGGAIGMGIPVATGAAIACPDRPVISFEADGSAFYTLQGLWTQAREELNVTTVICANSRYQILETELRRAGVTHPGPAASGMSRINAPVADWVSLATGLGVPAVRATTGDELVRALHEAYAEPGPHLIEAILSTSA